jgi:hypothetical protein
MPNGPTRAPAILSRNGRTDGRCQMCAGVAVKRRHLLALGAWAIHGTGRFPRGRGRPVAGGGVGRRAGPCRQTWRGRLCPTKAKGIEPCARVAERGVNLRCSASRSDGRCTRGHGRASSARDLQGAVGASRVHDALGHSRRCMQGAPRQIVRHRPLANTPPRWPAALPCSPMQPSGRQRVRPSLAPPNSGAAQSAHMTVGSSARQA